MNFDAWRHCLRGRLMMRLALTDAAMNAYLDALAADPASLRALAALGYLLTQRRHYDLAEPCLERAAQLAPGRADPWFSLGYAQSKAGRHAAAIASSKLLNGPKGIARRERRLGSGRVLGP